MDSDVMNEFLVRVRGSEETDKVHSGLNRGQRTERGLPHPHPFISGYIFLFSITNMDFEGKRRWKLG